MSEPKEKKPEFEKSVSGRKSMDEKVYDAIQKGAARGEISAREEMSEGAGVEDDKNSALD